MGHAVPMVTLNRLQRMGHNIVFVIGDFTAKIGDPTGRSSERPPLTEEQIQKNLSTYKEQVSPFFDMSKSKVVYNGEWLRNLTLNELLKTLSSINVSRVLQREDFRKRLDNQQGLAMSEMLYPIVMGMDSVELKKKEGCDIELGGKDQFLNMQMCRTLMELHGQEPEAIVSTDILEGISGGGLKMSKSLNNYIALNDSPENIFGKLMSIPDHLLELYYKSLTEISNIEREKIQTAITSKNISPMHIKKGLAKILITIIYNKDSAEQAEKQFNDKFSQKNYWELDLPLHTVDKHINLLDYITEKLKKSKSEIRRLADG
jgi:tyrosyl-tRNA synthetase